MIPKVFPEFLVATVRNHTHDLLLRFSRATGITHVAIGFVTEDLRWRFDARLNIGSLQTVDTGIMDGVSGRALREGQTIIYPMDRGTSREIVRVGNRVLILEVAAPIYYAGSPTAVVLADVFEGESILQNDLETLRRLFSELASKLSKTFSECQFGEISLSRAIERSVKECVKTTGSTRGYLAIKGNDGNLTYFGTDDETFFELSQTEGLCGTVFRNGELLNVPNVWEDPRYVASDPGIWSEIVVPIQDGAQTIAILNMESSEGKHYGESRVLLSTHGATVVRFASQLRSLVLSYRKLSVADSPVTDVIQELTQYSGAIVGDQFAAFVANCLQYALHAEQSLYWVEHERRPFEFGDRPWLQRESVEQQSLNDGRYLITAPIRSFGTQKAVIGMVMRNQVRPADTNLVSQVCRIAGEILEIKRQQKASRYLEELVNRILDAPDAATLGVVVHGLADLVGADFCTLFGRQCFSGRNYLVVAASTSDTILKHNHSEMFYRLGLQEDGYFDGLTGYVGSSGQMFRTANLDRMPKEEEERLRNLNIRWKRGMSENESGPISAYICLPVRSASGGVLGVLRMARTKDKGQLGDFDDESLMRLKIISRLLSNFYSQSGFLSPK